jgi:tetratricopeptide (TPR) repeat protein
LFTALHATGDYARELSEVRLARSELRRGDDLYVTEEARALAALGRSDEARAIANRLMSRQPASSVNINQLTIVALELKRHGAKAAGEALLSDIAAFALANESQLDSLAVASVLGAAGKYAESLARLEKLTATSTNQTRISRHGQVAALSGRRELAGQLAARITGATAAADMNRGYIAAASGDCPRAVAYFQGAHEKGFAFGAPGWWHNFVPTEPIWGCEAFNKLPPMKAPPR